MESWVDTSVSGKLGDTIPPNEVHAISVSLPSWSASVGWATRDPAVVERMRTGYPRFFIHRFIDTLAERIVSRLNKSEIGPSGVSLQLAMLFPYPQAAHHCWQFLTAQANDVQRNFISVWKLAINLSESTEAEARHTISWTNLPLHVVVYPSELFPLAKSFWQHTGFGISARYAELCLDHFGSLHVQPSAHTTGSVIRLEPRWDTGLTNGRGTSLQEGLLKTIRLEEGQKCKLELQRRLAKLASTSDITVDSSDVYLYPSGMSAWMNVVGALETLDGFDDPVSLVAYGFLYVDTYKVTTKIYGIETTLYGHLSATEIDELESELQRGRRIRALFLEVPGNPLLRSPDLGRLRVLADTYDFLIICDDTVGTSNVDILPYADVLWTSLTKMFSGACNVLGGSVRLNPRSRHYHAFHRTLSSTFIDTYYPPDAIIMEANSRDFTTRVHHTNATAEVLVNILEHHPLVRKFYYPKGSSTQKFYDSYKRPEGGYGHLFSMEFVAPEVAMAFFDHMATAKGPSLGTNFTLCTPQTLFAHYGEREWAAEYGVVEHLVRISVGLEEPDLLSAKILKALEAAGRALHASSPSSRDSSL